MNYNMFDLYLNEEIKGPVVLPLVPLRDIVLFPYNIAPLFVGRRQSVNALLKALSEDKTIFLSAQKNAEIKNPNIEDICRTGVIGKILQTLKLQDGSLKILVEGKLRGRIEEFIEDIDVLSVKVAPIKEDNILSTEGEAFKRSVIKSVKEYSNANPHFSKELADNIAALSEPSHVADIIAGNMNFKLSDKILLLETESLNKRFELLLSLIRFELEVIKVKSRIDENVKTQMTNAHKKYYLNEQMRAIKKEIGDIGEKDYLDESLKELKEEIEKKKVSPECEKKIESEFKRLEMMQPMSSEATVIRNYIDWLISLPWYETDDINNDIDKAENILNEDHYGLEKPKERILEYLAVQSLVKKIKGPILCLVGPPGVGKTSLAKSIARATARKFVRLSLGGVRDEAEIRGHRRTYIGAMPGKIIQSLKKAGTNNPVFCLDEVDKMSVDFRGDPSSALLEVLDPEQNDAFNDHYLDVDYDLSRILFITTANTLDGIPYPLQDRMEVIRLSGYTEYEKYKIAKNFLMSKQVKFNGISEKNIKFSKNAIMTIIREYTKEAGVRNLEREISSICRKIAKKIVKKDDNISFNISKNIAKKYLGSYYYRYGQIEKSDKIGVATGLAWTPLGGDILFIETIVMQGKGEIIMTGKLGDVMKESARAAISYVRSKAESLGIKKDFHKTCDLHIHVPEGAIPKDGPSAGIAMCMSIISALSKKYLYKQVAMTGEITLRGSVLPIGGLKEKILAALRGGIKKVLIPKENKKDLKEIPKNILSKIEIVLIEYIDECLEHALSKKND